MSASSSLAAAAAAVSSSSSSSSPSSSAAAPAAASAAAAAATPHSVDAATNRKRPADGASAAATATAATDRDALAALYHALGGDGWTRKDGWLTDAPLSKWYGVRVRDGRVRVLELSRNGLRGNLAGPALAPSLAQLSDALEQLWLSENALTGTLPSVLATGFPNLNILDVGSNTLRGALPPAFVVRSFSWFDTSGNQLTSYARLNRLADNAVNDDDRAAATSVPSLSPCTTVALSSDPSYSTQFSELWQAHISPLLLSADEGAALIALAEQWASEHAGWETSRHRAYKTTDVDVAVCGGGLLALCNAHLEGRILPLMAARFRFPAADLAVEDLFVAKYSADVGQQRALGEHRDGSELSFVITLNSPADFRGGGTRFIVGGTAGDDIVVAPSEAGTACFFCGRHLHSGVEVSSGTRYILAGFVRVFATSEEAKARLAHLKSIDADSRNQQGKRSKTQFGKKRRQ